MTCITDPEHFLKWMKRINQLRLEHKDLTSDAQKCTNLASELTAGEFGKLRFFGTRHPEQKDQVVAAGPKMELTAFRLHFGWTPEANTGIMGINGVRYASFGALTALWKLDASTPTNTWLPLGDSFGLVEFRLPTSTSERVELRLAPVAFKWTPGGLGSDLLEWRVADGQLQLRLAQTTEHSINEWLSDQLVAASSLIESTLHGLRLGTGGAGISGEGEQHEGSGD